MTTDKEAVRVEPMTHLERARAWYASNVRSRLNWTEDDEAKISGLASLLAQVTNEAYERAAEVCDADASSSMPSFSHPARASCVLTANVCAEKIRALKVS